MKPSRFMFGAKLGIAIIVLTAMGFWFYRSQVQFLRNKAEKELLSIASLKTEQIVNWRNERLGDAGLIMESPFLNEAVANWRAHPTEKMAELLRGYFRSLHKYYQYGDVALVDGNGTVLLDLSNNSGPLHEDARKALQIALKENRPVMVDLHTGLGNSPPHNGIVVPLTDPRAAKDISYDSAIVLKIDAVQFLYPLIQSWPTPSDTAETLLVRRDGGDVLFLNSLRFQKDAALNMRIPMSRTDLPAAMALMGKEGIVQGKDYRGVDVLAALKHIPDSDWFMVAKVDKVEALSYLRRESTFMLFIIFGLIALAGAVGCVIWQNRTKTYYIRAFEAQKSLLASEEQNRVTLMSVGDGVIVTDAEGRIRLLNPVAESLTGWKLKDALGHPIEEVFNIVNEETLATVESPVARVLREGRIVGLANHTVLLAKDGRQIPIADSGAPIRSEEGQTTGVVMVFRDQTEERSAQRLTRARLSLIDALVHHNLDEFLKNAIDEACALAESPIGFYHFLAPDQKSLSLQQWSSRTLEEFCHAEGKGLHYDIDKAGVWVDCVYSKKPVIHNDYASMEHRKGLPEGHAQVARELVVPVVRDNKVVAVLGVGNKPIDYTEKDAEIISSLADVTWDLVSNKRAQDALKESSEYLNKIINCIGDPIFVKNNRNEFVLVNDAMCTYTGIPRNNLLGTTGYETLREEAASALRTQDEKVLSTEKEYITEDTVTDNMGRVRIHMTRRNHLKNGDADQIVGIVRDITEYKRIEAQLHQAQKMEAIGVLAGGVAHDFNNLLTVINGYVELMLEDTNPDDQRYPDLEQILKAGQRASSLTSQLLAFSRKQILNPQVLNLNDVISDIKPMLLRIIGEDIDLKSYPHNDLHPVSADPGQLQQIIMNIAVNARDAMPQGGRLTIETQNVEFDQEYVLSHPQAHAGAYVLLAISDNGRGIEKADRERIFDPFFTTKEKGKGTGLGLATVYGIVKQSGGFIWVYSEVGKGTTFKIYFPKVAGEATPYKSGDKLIVPPNGSETILVVEDEASVRELAIRILREQGYTALEAKDGMEALSCARNYDGRIHMVITDVVMPGMSGKELMGSIKEIFPGIAVLYISGYTDNAIVHHGILDSDVAFLAKPFTANSLIQKVHELL